jgi:predicted TIM-barrel fold metal-dependent hydrolase
MDRLTGDAYAWLVSQSSDHRRKTHTRRRMRDGFTPTEQIVQDKPVMKHPKEYVKNLYPAVEVPEQLLPYTIEMYGCDNLILGSDYPHPDTFFPHTIPSLMALETISDEAKQKIVGGNARRLFGF